jgi:hypothetical protein
LSTEISFKHRSCISAQWEENEPNAKKWAFVDVLTAAVIARE